jgi:hypothetical protein
MLSNFADNLPELWHHHTEALEMQRIPHTHINISGIECLIKIIACFIWFLDEIY